METNNNIQEDSYWYTAEDSNTKEIVIKTMCVKCHSEKDKDFGWFWLGSNGYGANKINCSVCGKILCLKGEHEENN